MIPIEQYLFFAVTLYAFFYTLFWLKRWGAFNSSNENLQKKMTLKNESIEQSYILENIFLTKN